AALARKLVETDGVLGMAGGFSLIECDVNHSYYESKGIGVLNAGIAPSCWSTPNSAPVNMGPRYSSDGATQAVIRQDVDKIAFAQSDAPGTGYTAAHTDRAEHVERPDSGRQLGRGQADPAGRLERRSDPQLHAARGAQDPP